MLFDGVAGSWADVPTDFQSIVVVTYLVGALPAAATGAYAAIQPYAGALRFVASCAAAGLLFSVVEVGIIFLAGIGVSDMSAFALAITVAGLAGATASLPCTILLRFRYRKLLHPDPVAELFA